MMIFNAQLLTFNYLMLYLSLKMLRDIKQILNFWLIWLFCTHVAAQQALPFTEITLKNGLSQGMIFDILQTQDGFMWFATKDGLNRYDGYQFTVYRHNPADSFSVSDNTIIKLFEDSKQRLWVKTKKGLDIFDKKQQHFQHVLPVIAKKTQFNLDEFVDIEEDKAGNIWVAVSGEGIYVLKPLVANLPTNAQLAKYIAAELIQIPEIAGRIYDIFISSKQAIYLATHQNCYQIFAQNKQIIPLNLPYFPADIPTKAIVENPQGDLLMVKNKQILVWNQSVLETIPIPANIGEVENAWKDNQNRIWVSQQNNLWCLSEDDFSLKSLPEITAVMFEKQKISKIYSDKTHNIWIGTNGYGLRKINPALRHFHHAGTGNTVWLLAKDKQENVYVKNSGRISLLKPPYYKYDETMQKLYPYISFDMLLNEENFHWLLSSRDDEIQGVDNELVKCDLNWNKIVAYPIPFPLYQQTLLRKDKVGNFWINTTGSQIIRFQPNTGETKVFEYEHLFKEGGANAIMLYFDSENTIWIGTTAGLIKGKKQQEEYIFELFQNQVDNKFSLPNNVISAFCDDPQQPEKLIWIGTKGGGLVQMDKKTGKCVTYNEKQGLPNAVVYGILPDETGNLWISTNRGIAKFNPQDKHFQSFTQEDGLQDNEFNTQAFSKSPQGELCFGGINGFNIFKPSEIVSDTFAPNTVIVSLKVNNKMIEVGDSTGILLYSLQTPQTISLSYQQNYLSISFAALDFRASSKNQYKYKLEGADLDWVLSGNQTVANYTALAPGTYTFQVLGCNGNEVWSKTPASITIVIRPPFWRTYWAYTCYFVLLCFMAYQLYQYQIRRIAFANQLLFEQKEKERLAALEQLKSRFFSNVTHEFRTPLTLILAPANELVKALQDKKLLNSAQLIYNNGLKLLELVNQLLDLAKLENGNMKVDDFWGDVLPVIESIYASFAHLAQQKGLHFVWIRPEKIPNFSFDKDKLEKILHNLLSNAFKFTAKGGNIQLTTQVNDAFFYIEVKDDGIGMDENAEKQLFKRFYQGDNTATRLGAGTGIGLSLVKELVNLLGGSIAVKTHLGEGTAFEITLPIDAMPAAESPLIEYHSDEITPVFIKENIESQLYTTENGILLVEDNEDMRNMLRDILKSQGFEVITAADGKEGIEKAFAHTPKLIVSDVMMPEKDGYELVETLKNDFRTSHIPIILLTAKSSFDSRILGLQKGADEYLGKPFHSEELILRINRLIELQKRLQTTFQDVEKPIQTPVSTDEQLILSDLDQRFLTDLQVFIEKNIDNTELDVAHFTDVFFLSRSQLHRKMVALTQQSITEYLRNYRLAKAQTLLSEGKYNVNEVADMTGFGNPKYFATTYKKRYGVSPSAVSA